MKTKLLFAAAMLCFLHGYSQEKKSFTIFRTEIAPKIDGVLDDAIWQEASEVKGFTQFRPNVGVVDTEVNKTIVKMS